VIESLRKCIYDVTLSDEGFTRDGLFIYELFSKVNVTDESRDIVLSIVEQAISVLTETKMAGIATLFRQLTYSENGNVLTDSSLASFLDVLKRMFISPADFQKFYKVTNCLCL
jgi:hypothetical protein